jgi:hypothetical protein
MQAVQCVDCSNIYRVIKKYLCTWWLQYRKLQVMFKVSPASLKTFIETRLSLTPSVILNYNYVIIVGDWNCLKYFSVFLYCNHQVHRLFDHPVYVTLMRMCIELWFKIDIGKVNSKSYPEEVKYFLLQDVQTGFESQSVSCTVVTVSCFVFRVWSWSLTDDKSGDNPHGIWWRCLARCVGGVDRKWIRRLILVGERQSSAAAAAAAAATCRLKTSSISSIVQWPSLVTKYRPYSSIAVVAGIVFVAIISMEFRVW